jgi:hypothetical protein
VLTIDEKIYQMKSLINTERKKCVTRRNKLQQTLKRLNNCDNQRKMSSIARALTNINKTYEKSIIKMNDDIQDLI